MNPTMGYCAQPGCDGCHANGIIAAAEIRIGRELPVMSKAAAIATYAKIADDNTLHDMATRIRGRAVRRTGELLQEFQTGPKGGRPAENRGAGPLFHRPRQADVLIFQRTRLRTRSKSPTFRPRNSSRPWSGPTRRR
jgi:hypothetical protein